MKKLPLFFIAALLALETARADIRLPAIVSDHAMLQAGKPVAIWGWAKPGASITVSFDAQSGPPSGASFVATAGADGKWSGQLPVLATGAMGRLLVFFSLIVAHAELTAGNEHHRNAAGGNDGCGARHRHTRPRPGGRSLGPTTATADGRPA